MRIRYAVAALGATVSVAAGCGGSAETTESVAAGTAPTVASETTASVASVPAQLDFVAQTVGGQEFSGQTLAGKPAVFWFWAPWCPTCQREAPEVAEAARANPDATFVGVAALDQQPAMQEFVDRYDLDFFTNIADIDGAVWQRFGVTAQPAFAFVTADGSVDVVPGTLGAPALNTRISTLVNP